MPFISRNQLEADLRTALKVRNARAQAEPQARSGQQEGGRVTRTAPHGNRSRVSLTEHVQSALGEYVADVVGWTATFDGHLSTGEGVEMSRYGVTAEQALSRLEAAFRESGWTILPERATRTTDKD